MTSLLEGPRRMRIVVIGLLAVLLTGCITISQAPQTQPLPTPSATPTTTSTPTAAPTPTPTTEPTPSPTVPPTPSPAGTPDPDATPRPTVVDVLPYLTAQVTVVNLSDQPLSTSVTLLDPESTDTYHVGTFDVEPLQVTTQSVIPARLHLQFHLGAGLHIGTCTINVAEAEQIQFAVIEDGIAFTTSAGEPTDTSEMLVETSSRCHEEVPT